MSTKEMTKGAESGAVQYVTPRVEVSETENAVRLYADMPGVGLNGATVELHDDVLSLEGSVEKTNGRAPRHYRRRFNLSDPALFDLEKVSAKMSHGVLEVEIPKAAKPQPRQIKIATS